MAAAILAACVGCASEPPEPDPPIYTVPGARVERQGGGVFQYIPEKPKPRDPDDVERERESRAPQTYRPVEIRTLDGELIRGRLYAQDAESYDVLQAGSIRRVLKQDVKTIRVYPRNVRLPQFEEANTPR